ncbi:hypothetical protein VTO42DRAFT_3307 [Malbranchea cinnamomea]
MSAHSSRVITPADGGGPSAPPPTVPEGWLAQWESRSQRWYYVQRATGRSQWEVPTEPFIPTPTSTPQSVASPGPYHPPSAGNLPPSDAEATQELIDVSTGANWRPSSGSFTNNPYDNSQNSPISGQTQHSSPSSMQRTPVASGSNVPSRTSSHNMFSQVVSDLANRSASSEMTGIQQSAPQHSHGYPAPSQTVTPGSDYMNMNPQYPQDPQQSAVQMQGYQHQNQADSMQVDDTSSTRKTPQDPNTTYRGDGGSPQYMQHPAPGSIMQGPNYFQSHQNAPMHSMGEIPPNQGQVPVSTGSPYQQYSGQMSPPGPQQPPYGGPVQQSGSPFQNTPPGQPGQTQAANVPPSAPAPEPEIITIQSDPNKPLFPTPYSEAQARKRERQESYHPPRNYQSGPPQPQYYDSHYQHAPDRPPSQGYEPRPVHAPDYYDRGGQSYPGRDPAYPQGIPPQHHSGGYYHDPRYEPRGGEYAGYSQRRSPDQRAPYAMPRQPSQGSGGWPPYDQGPPPPTQAYAPSHQPRYSGGGGYPAGRGR